MTEHLTRNRPSVPFSQANTGELVKRTISAIVLGAIGIGATLAGTWPLAIVVSLISAVLAWEWGRLVRNCEFDDLLFAHIAALLIAIALATTGFHIYAMVTLIVGFVAIAVRRSKEYVKLSGLGVPYIGIAAVGIIWLRQNELGLEAILFIFACVWAPTRSPCWLAAQSVGPVSGPPYRLKRRGQVLSQVWPPVSWSGRVHPPCCQARSWSGLCC